MAPLLSSSQNLDLLFSLECLTQNAFSSFGSVISCPLHAAVNAYPVDESLTVSDGSVYPSAVSANQATALKYSPIAQLANNYHSAPSKHPGQSVHSLFACFPRTLRRGRFFDVRILERHPFTTQTFAPLGHSQKDGDTCYVVVVALSQSGTLHAKTDSGDIVPIERPPDLTKLKAFVAHSGQAVVYGAGTWHAPMIVVGKKRMDFLVTQFISGVASEDCEEVAIGGSVCLEIFDEKGERSVTERRFARL